MAAWHHKRTCNSCPNLLSLENLEMVLCGLGAIATNTAKLGLMPSNYWVSMIYFVLKQPDIFIDILSIRKFFSLT